MTAAERQLAPTLEGIREDHLARYRFAASRVAGSVLDAGCGCGYGTAILADAGCRVRGVDVSAEAIEYAELHYSGARRMFVRAEAGLVAGAYDWVVCFEMLEHVQDDGGLLRHFATIAPRLIVSVPNQEIYPFDSKRNPFHVRHYRHRELDALLRGAGFAALSWRSQASPSSPDVLPGIDGLYLVVEAQRA